MLMPDLDAVFLHQQNGPTPAIGETPLPIIQEEINWRQPVWPVANGASQSKRPILSRWRDLGLTKPVEMPSDIADESHILSMVVRPTQAELLIDRRMVWSGHKGASTFFLNGPPQGRWRAIFRSPYDHVRLYLPQALLAECFETVFKRPAPGLITLFETSPVEDRVLRQLGETLRSVAFHDDIGATHVLEAISLAFAARLLGIHYGRRFSPQPWKVSALSKWRLKLVIDYIEAHLGRPIYLSELSALVGLSRMHFASQFRKATGYSPHAYVLSRKIGRAQERLLGSNARIVEIALEMGFSSQGHFTESFRRHVGETPAQWRKLHKGR